MHSLSLIVAQKHTTLCGQVASGVIFTEIYMDITDNIDPPNPPMTQDQQSVANSLSLEFVQAIDDELISYAISRNRKVVRLVMSTMSNPKLRVPGLPDLFYAQRVKVLVSKGLLISEGNLDYMQYSEVRLP